MKENNVYRIISVVSITGIASIVIISILFKNQIGEFFDNVLTYLLIVFLIASGVAELMIWRVKRK
jgi:uncharacterized membrane protein HdeD (DUF308 family)